MSDIRFVAYFSAYGGNPSPDVNLASNPAPPWFVLTGWRLVEMDTVGAFEAKSHLSALLERVAKGENFTITKHGKPVAMLRNVSAVYFQGR